ncbi:hypothetical protein PV458_25205 [Streptomyces sp. MN03-5084-2B]|nr:hypothetical protein [Streptomyces sp. MN03-5084-2B]
MAPVELPDPLLAAGLGRPFTFHESRHTHSTWLTEDRIPEVARRARLGQKMKGIARVYDHVTPAMANQILNALRGAAL